MAQLHPLAGYVVVKRLEEMPQAPAGIILTDNNKEKPQKGEVIAVGPGLGGLPSQVQVGQTVVFKKYGPTEITVDGEDFLILEENQDILAIYEA